MATVTVAEVEYPTSDGKPMAETDIHRDQMVEAIEVLKGRYANDPDVYVSGNLLIYYVEGKPRKHRSPDVFVVWGVPKHDRLVYKIWEECVAPQVVIEITSKTTRKEDLKEKLVIYRDEWKVREYFLFDPLGDYLDPPLQGHRLVRGKYKPIEPDENGRLHSELLGLDLEARGKRLVFWDPATGKEVVRPEVRFGREMQERAEKAETELEKLRQELEALRRQRPTKNGRSNHRKNGE